MSVLLNATPLILLACADSWKIILAIQDTKPAAENRRMGASLSVFLQCLPTVVCRRVESEREFPSENFGPENEASLLQFLKEIV
jgi:hypothetical protein